MKKIIIFLSVIPFTASIFSADDAEKEKAKKQEALDKAFALAVELNLSPIDNQLLSLRANPNTKLGNGSTPFEHYYNKAKNIKQHSVETAACLLAQGACAGEQTGKILLAHIEKKPSALDKEINDRYQYYRQKSRVFRTLQEKEQEKQDILNDILKATTTHLASVQKLCTSLRQAGAQLEESDDESKKEKEQ